MFLATQGDGRFWSCKRRLIIITSFRFDHGIHICDRLQLQKTLSKKGVWRALASDGSYQRPELFIPIREMR